MEFGTREILIVLGIVVIFGILLHGYWRVRRFHSGSLKVSRRKQAIFDDEVIDELPGELPTGEVRVTQRDEETAEVVSDSIKRYRERNAEKQTSAFRERFESDKNVVPFQTPQEPSCDSESAYEPPDESVGYVEEPQAPAEEAPPVQEAVEQVSVSLSEFDIEDDEQEAAPEPQAEKDVLQAENPDELDNGRKEPVFALRNEDADVAGSDTDTEPFKLEPDSSKKSGKRRPFWEEKERSQPAAEKKPKPGSAPPASQNDVIILHVMAKKEKLFNGSELLDALLANNLRFGSMQIFHRHEQQDGAGPILFSLANSLNPGTFDLTNMESFETPGVTLLMPLEGLVDPLDAYHELIKTARDMSKALGGVVQDETRSVLTKQTVEHYRQQIIEFTRRSFTLTN